MIIRVLIGIFLLSVMAPAAWAGSKACAHRGDVAVAPENTLPAIALAIEKGAAMIEFDVQRTKDGALVLMHDANISRTTNGSGRVGEMTLAALRELDAGAWFSEAYAGTRIPTLEEALAVTPRSILCNVHLKGDGALGRDTALKLKALDRLDHCFLAATPAQIETARAAVPEILICHMGQRIGNRAAYIETAIAERVNFVQLHYKNGTEELPEAVARLHAANIMVNWFGAQDEPLIRTLAAAGVDYILSDDLDLCLRVLEAVSEEQAKPSETVEVSAGDLRRPTAVSIDARGDLAVERDTSAPWAFRHKVLVGEACPCPEHLGRMAAGAEALTP